MKKGGRKSRDTLPLKGWDERLRNSATHDLNGILLVLRNNFICHIWYWLAGKTGYWVLTSLTYSSLVWLVKPLCGGLIRHRTLILFHFFGFFRLRQVNYSLLFFADHILAFFSLNGYRMRIHLYNSKRIRIKNLGSSDKVISIRKLTEWNHKKCLIEFVFKMEWIIGRLGEEKMNGVPD